MSALPWILGGAAVGVGFLVWRSRQAAKETAETPGVDVCAALAKAGVPSDVCKLGLPVVGAIVDAIDGAVKTPGDVREWDRKNKELNGPVRIANEGALRKLTYTCTDPSNCFTALDGTVIEFENGCVPIAGSPGFAKCAPGTQPMLNYPVLSMPFFVSDGPMSEMFDTRNSETDSVNYSMSGAVRTKANASDAAKRDPYDLFTRGGYAPGSYEAGGFPVPIPEGHIGYIYKARPFTCPKGQPPVMDQLERDWREDAADGDANWTPPCGGSAWGGGPSYNTERAGVGGFASVSTTIADCTNDPNFVWDPAGYCRRKRVGEL